MDGILPESAGFDHFRDEIRHLAWLGAERLATELVELAQFDPFAARCWELLAADDQPDKLATVLRTHLADLERDARSVRPRGDDNDFADRLEEIRAAIGKRVWPHDPALDLELHEDLFAVDAPPPG